MEFYRVVNVSVFEEDIQKDIIPENIESFSNQLFKLGESSNEQLSIGSLWGEFTLLRQVIRGGIRFVLKECPNALQWTITTGFPPEVEAIILHLTINRKSKDQIFIEEIEEFLDDHSKMLIGFFNNEV